MSIWEQVIALTGGIGSGKSTALKRFATLGAYTFSADDLAREVVAPASEGYKKIVETFGASFLRKDASIDRKKLAQLVFSDPEQRKKLEAIVHPLISSCAEQKVTAALGKNHFPIVYEIPLLFENGLQSRPFKDIIVVYASPEICLTRTMTRDACTKEQALARINAQLSLDTKKALARTVFVNEGTPLELERQVDSYMSTHKKIT